MTMHLAHPSLSLSGKKKGKTKFRNATEAQKARDLDADWLELQKKWGVAAEDKKRKRALASEVWRPEPATHRGANEPKIASVDTGWAPCSKAPEKVYTGTEMLGIGQLHKSNAIPIFRQQDAEDLAKMRR